MAGKQIDMSHLKQILRLHLQGVPIKKICESTPFARNTVRKYIRYIEQSNRPVDELLDLPDEELYGALFGSEPSSSDRNDSLTALFPHYESELKRTGVNLLVLWAEYRKGCPTGYGYSRFCELFSAWRLTKKVTMHMEHEPGDQIFVDFAGKKLHYVDPTTGELKEVEVFIASLGYSHYTYVEPIESQQKDDVRDVICNTFEYLGGVPKAIVLDNFKSAVTRADNHEPVVDRDLLDLANHYGTVILPTRSSKPRDKAIVEKSVSLVYSYIFAPLRDIVFHSLHQLKQAVHKGLLEYNARPFQVREGSRKEVFDAIEKSSLRPLPTERFELRCYKQLKVQPSGHLFLSEDKHYYSVPYRYIGKKVLVIYTSRHVNIYFNHDRIAYHPRNKKVSGYSTLKEHMSSAHQYVGEWSSERFINWAATIGPEVATYVTKVLELAAHPEQAYKACSGILHFAKKYGHTRLISAVCRATDFESYSYSTIRNILKSGLDAQSGRDEMENQSLPKHENIRGPKAYQ
jgi:transposase